MPFCIKKKEKVFLLPANNADNQQEGLKESYSS